MKGSPSSASGSLIGAGAATGAPNGSIVEARRAASERDGSLVATLIDTRDADAVPLTTDEIVSHLILMLFAGHDTTASLSTWLCFEFMRRPDIRERARAEVLDVCGAEGPLDHAMLAKLRYVSACIREAERLYPPAPTGFRGVTRELEFGEFVIPAGWTVVYSPLYTHHMAALYPNPGGYDPERFLGPSERPLYSLVGFGGGLRKCVGEALAQLELKIVAASWLRHVEAETDVREPGWEYIPALHPKGRLPTRLVWSSGG